MVCTLYAVHRITLTVSFCILCSFTVAFQYHPTMCFFKGSIANLMSLLPDQIGMGAYSCISK